MPNIYKILEYIEKRPAMLLGNDYGIKALNDFTTGFWIGGGKSYDKTLNYPDFSLFTDWLGGLFKYKYEQSSSNWSWMLFEKYKEDKKALEKFFFYLNLFKKSEPEVFIIKIKASNIQHALENKNDILWCSVGNQSKAYYNNIKKLNEIILFKLNPSRTLFSLLVDNKGKILDTRNVDMTEKRLKNNIEMQFGLNLQNVKPVTTNKGNTILRQFKII